MIKKYSITLKEKPINDGEIWIDLKDWDNKYSVSNLGRIWSYNKSRLLNQFKMQNGYIRVNLTKNKVSRLYLLHRIVALSFLQNHENKKEVNHIDGNRENNKLSNLEWSTRQENVNHYINAGRGNIGENRPDAKLKEHDIENIFNDRFQNKMTQESIAIKYGVSRRAIRKILNKESWKHIKI